MLTNLPDIAFGREQNPAVNGYKSMLNHAANTSQNNRSIFNVYLDLFDKGEFNEMIITCQAGEYQVDLGDMYLGTIACKGDNCWELVKGSLPSAVISDIAKSIARKVKN